MARGLSVFFRAFSSAGSKCFGRQTTSCTLLPGVSCSRFYGQSHKSLAGRHVLSLPHVRCCTANRQQHSHSATFNSGDLQEEPFNRRDWEERRRELRQKPLEEIVEPHILTGEPLSVEQWRELKEQVLGLRGFINEVNFDGIVMGMCCGHRQFKVGDSLLEYIEQSGTEPNISTLSGYLRLCYVCNAGDTEKILAICDRIRRTHPVLDANTAEKVILGLVLTPRWEEGLELLATTELSAIPSSGSFNALAKAAFDKGELQKGWDLIEKMLVAERRPHPEVYQSWLEQCGRVRGEESSVMVAQLLNFWADHDLRPTLTVAEDLRTLFERDAYSWEGCFTELTPRGSCINCHTVLRPHKLQDSEFEALRKQFFDRVLLDTDPFLKTNPEELETFQQFLARTAPYDVVIDGLNAAHATGATRPIEQANTLHSVVRHFAARNRRILVLGRRHMQQWPRSAMNYIHDHASVFLAQDVSQDDPFLLFATMYSGPRTQFVSKDLMRGHLYLLKDPGLRRTFRRWQQQRQIQLLRVAQGEVTVKAPLHYNPSVQQGPGSVWHVPYDQEFRVKPKQTYEPPRTWLCLQKMTPS